MLHAEDLNYWKTSRSGADTWIDKAIKELESIGAEVLQYGMVNDVAGGRAAYMIQFSLEGNIYRVVDPIIASKSGSKAAERIQAATSLYHEIKARAVAFKRKGAMAAYGAYLLLPSGRTVSESTSAELVNALPSLLTGGDVVEGKLLTS